MARRPPAAGSSVLPQQTPRQNEYFVPRDGIDREVITADICRYLGNDALVRPGNYENPENGQMIQGYFINAYRNLTSAMIQDLKADSARWDAERRQQSANRSSAGGVQYRNSDIHQLRQHYGPTENSYSANDPYDNGPRYPGTGTSGYTGAAGAYSQQYAAGQGGYTQQGYTANSAQFPPPGNVPTAYGAGHPVAAASYNQAAQDPPYNIVGANLRAGSQPQTDPYGNDPYGTTRDPRGDPRDHVTTMPPARATYTTAGPSPSQAYAPTGTTTSYYPQGSTPASVAYPQAVQPGDPFYGRASPAGTAAYNAAPEQQYESTPALKRISGSSHNTQLPNSGPAARHRSDRDSVERHTVDRHNDSRHSHRPHRPVR